MTELSTDSTPFFERTRVLDIDLAEPLPEAWDMPGYRRALVLVRWQGRTLTRVELACPEERLSAAALRAAVAANHPAEWAIAHRAVQRWLLGPERPAAEAAPSWTVVVCTRDRAEDLRRCLRALVALESPPGAPPGEILIVDNAPSDDAAARVVAAYVDAGTTGGAPPHPGRPAVRYLREDRPGLNWARARGARAARGDVVAYTDDDAVVDPRWIVRLLEPFADPRVAAVTGLTMPLELETPAQVLFEQYGGFGRGFMRRVFDPLDFPPVAAGEAGAGVNVAFRRRPLVDMGLFEVELDAGTVTLTGGDTYALYRVLAAGYHVVYTPDAVVWHRHRREYAPLRRTLYGYSVGGFAYLTRCLVEHRDLAALRTAAQWLRQDHVRMLGRLMLRRPRALPRDLVLAYWRGIAVGPWTYLRSRRVERRHRRADAARLAEPAAPAARGLAR